MIQGIKFRLKIITSRIYEQKNLRAKGTHILLRVRLGRANERTNENYLDVRGAISNKIFRFYLFREAKWSRLTATKTSKASTRMSKNFTKRCVKTVKTLFRFISFLDKMN